MGLQPSLEITEVILVDPEKIIEFNLAYLAEELSDKPLVIHYFPSKYTKDENGVKTLKMPDRVFAISTFRTIDSDCY